MTGGQDRALCMGGPEEVTRASHATRVPRMADQGLESWHVTTVEKLDISPEDALRVPKKMFAGRTTNPVGNTEEET